jgi:hypothetical protein
MAGRSTRLRRVGIWSRPPTDRCYRATGELLTQTPETLLPTACSATCARAPSAGIRRSGPRTGREHGTARGRDSDRRLKSSSRRCETPQIVAGADEHYDALTEPGRSPDRLTDRWPAGRPVRLRAGPHSRRRNPRRGAPDSGALAIPPGSCHLAPSRQASAPARDACSG